MTVRWPYIVALSMAFLLGLAGTVLAAKALGNDDASDARPVVHEPVPRAPLPTIEC